MKADHEAAKDFAKRIIKEYSERNMVLFATAYLELTAEVAESAAEHNRLIEYARKVHGSRDVHSVYEVLDEVADLKAKLVEANSMEGRSCWVDGCENLAQRCDAHSFGEGAENAARYAIEIMRLTERATAAEAENATLRVDAGPFKTFCALLFQDYSKNGWGGDIDGLSVQEWGLQAGLLYEKPMTPEDHENGESCDNCDGECDICHRFTVELQTAIDGVTSPAKPPIPGR